MTPQEAADRLKAGELVVFPTETVYGLGALASSDEAVQRIFEIKGRPQHNPLILHITDISQLDTLVTSIPESAKKLIDAFWPGPLTICFHKSKQVSDLITAGLNTVCIRMPQHPIAKEMLAAVGEAVAAPSANLSGRPSTTRFTDALAQLEQDGVSFLDGGDSLYGLESTVVDCTGSHVTLLRPGTISQQDLEKVLDGNVISYDRPSEVRSPGQLLSHYAPQGKLTVIVGNRQQRRVWIEEQVDKNRTVFGLVGPSESLNQTQHQYLSKEENDLLSYAQNLYRFLNWCDEIGAQDIVMELPESTDSLYPTLINRLEKASNGNIRYLNH